MCEAQWTIITNFPDYLVSRTGDIYSSKSGTWRTIKQILNKDGYYCANLQKDRIKLRVLIHRLVLTAFSGPCPPGQECRHLDGDRTNNNITNLRWGSRLENSQDRIKHGRSHNNHGERAGGSKLTASTVIEIVKLRETGMTRRAIAKQYGIPNSTIGSILGGYTWCHTTGITCKRKYPERKPC